MGGSDFSSLYCLSFYLWFLTFPHCIVCPSIYGFRLFPIVLTVLLFMRTDNTMGKIQTMVGKILSRKLMREQTILKTSVTRHVILDKNLSTGVSVTSQKSARLSTCVRGISSPLYCLFFYLWFQTFPHGIVCSSIYGFRLFPIVLSVLLFMVSDF
jgi:hypothetical protein